MAIGNIENLFEMDVTITAKIEWPKIKLLEMGSIKRKCHSIIGDTVQQQNLKLVKKLGLYPSGGAKYYYLKVLGINKHVSIDLNGAWKSLKLDLDVPLPDDFYGDFNLITNYGTGEHVNNQHSFFKNVHDCCEVGGVMIHALNAPGYIVCHGRYEYELMFIEQLSTACHYEIVLVKPAGSYKSKYKHKGDPWYDKVNFVAFRKTLDEPFVDLQDFAKMNIIDTGFTARTGNYNTSKAKGRVKKLRKKQIEEFSKRGKIG